MPLNLAILRALADGPKQQTALRGETEFPAASTLRAQLRTLVEVGALDKQRRNHFPGVLEYALTPAGRDLLHAAGPLERWLALAPGGPLKLGDNPARAAIRALADGWSTTMLRALSAGPLSLTKLDSVIASLSYPALERRLGMMRLAGLIEARSGHGRGTPYAVTGWLRLGVAPLAVAARWERRHRSATTPPMDRLDTEATLMLAVPLLHLPAGADGSCRLAAEIPAAGGRLAGVTVTVEAGRIASCTTRLGGRPDAWVLGRSGAWLDAIVEQDWSRLELGGDGNLARTLLSGLHGELFAVDRSRN